MLPSTIVRALTTPAFEPDHFTARQWSTAEDNAEIRKRANEVRRQSVSASEFQQNPVPTAQQYIRTYCALQYRWVLFDFLRARRGQGGFPRSDASLALLRRSDLHILRRRARRPAAPVPEAPNVIEVFRMREADATRKRELDLLCSLASEIRHRRPASSLFLLAADLAVAGRPVRDMTRRTGRGEDDGLRKSTGRPSAAKGGSVPPPYAQAGRIPALRAAFAPAGTPALSGFRLRGQPSIR